MLNAFASAASAFCDALPPQVPLKDSIREELEGEITVAEVIRCKTEMIVLATSDETGETTFDMVHADRAKLCKDNEYAIGLDQIDFSYRYIIPFGVVWIMCVFLISLEGVLLKSFYTFVLLLTPVLAGLLYFGERDVRYKSYEKALRERIILDRIALSRKEICLLPNTHSIFVPKLCKQIFQSK